MAAWSSGRAARRGAGVCPPEADGLPFPREGFPRTARLTRGADFQFVFRNARRTGDSLFTVLCVARREPGPARLGLAVGKRNLPRAVDRNRIKRLVRESFRQHRHDLPGVDCVVMAGRGARSADGKTLLESLQRHWRRLRGGLATRPHQES